MSDTDGGAFPGPSGDGLPEGHGVPAGTTLPSFPARVVQLFFSPGTLTEALASRPAWGAAMALGLALVVAQMGLIPAEVWSASMREAAMRAGGEAPPDLGAAVGFVRVAAMVAGTIGYAAFLFLLAGVVTLVFAFAMGDEGRYTQYLAVYAHAALIPAVVGLLLLPLKISQQDPRFTLNLGSFLFFLPDGYLAKAVRMLDLSQVWSWLVVAQGAHAIDARRSFGSAAAVVMGILVIMTLLLALVPGAG